MNVMLGKHQLDKIECEMVARWIVITKKRSFRLQIKKAAVAGYRFYTPCPDYPDPPHPLVGIEPLVPRTPDPLRDTYSLYTISHLTTHSASLQEQRVWQIFW
ncbi:hypothetical protein RvY_13045 [Ramazzottius varieornatus]|uniref:Uncharacterized protein n=1 Tax=Ramazzottius varieornatus TaxID=947166 RepID=A0A1D1VU48_RAMVA|nr:hypothetical protein RvY_13045 [Ramazzottius varieornatus]